MGKWRFHRDAQPWANSLRLFISYEDGNRTLAVVQPLSLEVIEAGLPYDKPTLASDQFDVIGFLQAALDSAWEAGLRPTGFTDPTNELAAVRYHLEDMRALAKVPRRGDS